MFIGDTIIGTQKWYTFYLCARIFFGKYLCSLIKYAVAEIIISFRKFAANTLRFLTKDKPIMLSRSFNKLTRFSQFNQVAQRSMASAAPSDAPPKRVLVSGAAGQIAYSIVFRIASGEFLGKNQRIILHLLDLPF